MIEHEKLNMLALYPEFTSVYGPYVRNDGRRYVVFYAGSRNTSTSRLYAKVRLEIKLGRRLIGDETVDHINDNPFDDSYENLQCLTQATNAQKHMRSQYPVFAYEMVVNCEWCREKFIPKRREQRFCTRSCSGRYNASLNR